MFADIFNTILYQPLYNGLVFLTTVVPFGDVGVAIIILTIIVKTILLPLAHKSSKTQANMRAIEPEMQKIKEEYKDDKEQQAKKVMALYREHGVNPFSGCVIFIIQIPIIIALYWVFWKGLSDGFDPALLYSFVTVPEVFNMNFLGIIDMAGRSITLALLAGITQYFQIKLVTPNLPAKKPKPGAAASFKEELGRSMQMQMKYGLPVFVAVIAYTISAAVALYWMTSNLYSIIHELYVRRQAQKVAAVAEKEELV